MGVDERMIEADLKRKLFEPVAHLTLGVLVSLVRGALKYRYEVRYSQIDDNYQEPIKALAKGEKLNGKDIWLTDCFAALWHEMFSFCDPALYQKVKDEIFE